MKTGYFFSLTCDYRGIKQGSSYNCHDDREQLRIIFSVWAEAHFLAQKVGPKPLSQIFWEKPTFLILGSTGMVCGDLGGANGGISTMVYGLLLYLATQCPLILFFYFGLGKC